MNPVTSSGVKRTSSIPYGFSVAEVRNPPETNKDTLASSASGETKESWGGFVQRVLCYVPNLIWTCIKQVVRVLTCGFFCSDKPSSEEIKGGLQEVFGIWNSPDATNNEKRNVWEKFCKTVPYAKQWIIDLYVDVQKAAAISSKCTEQEKQEWEERFAPKQREEAEKQLKKYNPAFLESALEKLEGSKK